MVNTQSSTEQANIFLEDIFEINWTKKTARVRSDSDIMKLHFWIVPWVFLKELLLLFGNRTNFFGKDVVFLWKVPADADLEFQTDEDTIFLLMGGKKVISSTDISYFGHIHQEIASTVQGIVNQQNSHSLPHWKQFQFVTNSWFHEDHSSINIGDTFWWYWDIPQEFITICPEWIPDSIVEESCAQMIANAYGKRNVSYTMLYWWSASLRLNSNWFQAWNTISITWTVIEIERNNLRAQYICRNSEGTPIFRCEILGSKFPMRKLVNK